MLAPEAALEITQPFERARTELLYGQWLRRSRGKAVAATYLTRALDALDLLGARPWAAHARAELEATGAKPPQESRSTRTSLTTQELRIVCLAADGLSNKEIAAQMILSPRTVGYHLYKAYPKLGVTSRAQLPTLNLGAVGVSTGRG
ncbi:helix-turn-helix transcriptional regulator [Nonomuraea insulae]|uniref:Response regulator transcription factor n=1 Tax=Nonomuraea insulae TaxID=1616787 RepID=A0ABW1CNL9_9ACTN